MANKPVDTSSWFHLDDKVFETRIDELEFTGLPPILPCFSVPNLLDKPQNPIVEKLKVSGKNSEWRKNYSTSQPPLPPVSPTILDSLEISQPDNGAQTEDSIWDRRDLLWYPRKNELLSWDSLRSTNQQAPTSTPFLSERDSLVYASARHHVQPRLKDPSTHIIYANQVELFSSLKMVVLGNSSLYHLWDPELQLFRQIGVREGKRGYILLDGKDEIISNSVMSRFLTIGSLLRRLEILVDKLRNRSGKDGTTIHAFTHALSNILDWLRKTLVKCPPSSIELSTGNLPISQIWLQYEPYEDILTSLAELCGCEEMKMPEHFHPFKYKPIDLLSRVYNHLEEYFNRQYSRALLATMAYILTCTSREYLLQISHSVGYGPQPPQKQERVLNLALDEYTLDEDAESEEGIFELLDRVDDDYPSFFPPNLLAVLPAAQRSLIILRKAQPDHPLLIQPGSQADVRWFWRPEDIEAAYLNAQHVHQARSTQANDIGTYQEAPAQEYKPGLEGLKVFDMEPGSSTQKIPWTPTLAIGSVQDFINTFPKILPPITPTLSDLASVVFGDLFQHSSMLSSTLLDLYLYHPGELNFRSHLVLLRDFLLITSSPFKSKLSFALFSDKEDYEMDNKDRTLSFQTLRQRKQITESTQPWAVGLSSSLLEREIWPPVGADLSFFLRTVIVDSLEYPQSVSDISKQVVNDASWRLGFAIRDLPTGPGRDKWLNPLCVEAFDFLYMDYKTPRPLEVLIPHEVLSKYQRMFTFLLRLVRVEHALLAIHRMMRSAANPIFPTLTTARRQTLHFRFLAQSFMNALSSYVFDTVIGGNFDPFLAELNFHHNADGGPQRRFSDIFELAKHHSSLLDDILSACLMRSGQRAAGDLLRNVTEIILELAIVIGELRRARLQEYQAAPMVEDLFAKFRAKMATLTRVLKGLVEKSTCKTYAEHFFIGQRNLPGGLEALHHLLLRIDTLDWWSTAS